jgi:hypothetical protein
MLHTSEQMFAAESANVIDRLLHELVSENVAAVFCLFGEPHLPLQNVRGR